MIIAIMVLVLVNTAVVAYLAMLIFDMNDKVLNGLKSQLEIMKLQNKLLRDDLDALSKWEDTTADLIAHVERIEDMEGDIKDIFEWIHSIDDNVAGMRMDIQETDTKLVDLMAVHDRDMQTFSNNLQSLQKDITEIGTNIDTNACWIRSVIDNGDTDGDIPTNIISGRGNYRQFLSSSDKDVDALYKEVVDHAIKSIDTTLEGEDNDNNGNE